ncbi:hypothetical protein EJ04DRAFT_574547 [Polyplosphaeria fusca]|uniref:Uncharacterized protein n=1 Tax=Polyplosphaeria fusca TaxID=682080 RepID=A0A9P4R5Z6_9PLEO|nr:hypothetical protein EJ04DRAFT_574547 [Polyplosphaeria fusca]
MPAFGCLTDEGATGQTNRLCSAALSDRPLRDTPRHSSRRRTDSSPVADTTAEKVFCVRDLMNLALKDSDEEKVTNKRRRQDAPDDAGCSRSIKQRCLATGDTATETNKYSSSSDEIPGVSASSTRSNPLDCTDIKESHAGTPSQKGGLQQLVKESPKKPDDKLPRQSNSIVNCVKECCSLDTIEGLRDDVVVSKQGHTSIQSLIDDSHEGITTVIVKHPNKHAEALNALKKRTSNDVRTISEKLDALERQINDLDTSNATSIGHLTDLIQKQENRMESLQTLEEKAEQRLERLENANAKTERRMLHLEKRVDTFGQGVE